MSSDADVNCVMTHATKDGESTMRRVHHTQWKPVWDLGSYRECRCVSWWHVAFVLACISPATTEMFAPSTRYSDTEYVTDEVSIVAFVGLAAAMHVVHGYVADCCGVGALSLGGLVLYVTSSVVVGLGDDVGLDVDLAFICMRVIQGIGASACTVASLACVHMHLDAIVDVPTMYTARAFILVLAPALSEFLCSLTNDWHAAFLLMGFGGSVCLVVVVLGSRSSCVHSVLYRNMCTFVRRRRACVFLRSSPCRSKLRACEWRTIALAHLDSELEPHSSVLPLPQVQIASTHSNADEADVDDATSRTTECNTLHSESDAHSTSESMVEGSATSLVPFAVWIVADGFGFGAMFVWITYAPQLEDVEYFGYMYSLTFVGSVVGSIVAQCVPTTRHVSCFVTATWVQLCAATMSYLTEIAQTRMSRVVVVQVGDSESLSSPLTLTTFALTTLSNGARSCAASHATACAMKASSALSPGRASALLHSIRMGITCCMLVVALASSPWLVIVSALAGAVLIIHLV